MPIKDNSQSTKQKSTQDFSSDVAAQPTVKLNVNWSRLFSGANKVAFGTLFLAVLVGLFVLLFGLVTEINGAARASSIDPSAEEVAAARQTELEAAWSDRDWARAITILEEMHGLEPGSVPVAKQLAQAYLQQGLTLRSRGFVEDALESFEQGLLIMPGAMRLQQEARLASAYLAGTQYYQQGQWPEAILELEKIWTEEKSYINVHDLLYSAQYNHGLAQQAAGNLSEAKQAFEAATILRPDLSAPRRILAEIEFGLAPGSPANVPSTSRIEDRLILVGIAEQQMLVFDGDKQVFDFVVSTGEPGSDTAVGEFEILNKIDNAYASSWNLDMPYWMGIYWAGPLQNGIHALPIVKHTGSKLWDGYLGQRVSYGCVILGDEDAATLYEWTEVGTKIKIVPSITSWLQENEPGPAEE